MDNIKAALLGVAIGDALGATVEFMSKDEIKKKYGVHRDIIGGGWLNLEPGETTDDTAMTLCVARGIVANPDHPRQHIGEQFVKWYRTGPKDIGNTCRAAIEEHIRSGYWQDDIYHEDQEYQAGNGALMRCIYPALFYKDLQDAMRLAQNQGAMTHFSNTSSEAIALYTTMIHTALDQPTHELSLLAATLIVRDSFPIYEDIWKLKSNDLKPTGYVIDSLRTALWYVLMKDFSFEEALIRAVNKGGDADTIGAIAGGLAGAIWGMEFIPVRWLEALDPAVREEIEELAEKAIQNRSLVQ
jgi:ADP-ribosyl-[dinitrogen reductase] hydrolase